MQLAIILGFMIGLFQISIRSFKFDEIFSLLISQNFNQLIGTLWNNEGNMWFYYFLLHFWQIFSTNELWIRLLSVIFGVMTIPLVYKIGLRLNKQTALLSSLLLPLNLLWLIYIQQGRGYSLLLFLTTLSTYLTIKISEENKTLHWFLFTIVSILAVYTHLYAGLWIFAEGVGIFIFKKYDIKRVFSFFSIIFLSILPLILSPAFKSGQIDWISKPSLISLAGTLVAISSDFPPLLAVYLLIMAINFKGLSNKIVQYLYLLLFLPIAAAFIFSLNFRPIYQSVYFIMSTVPILLIVSYGVSKIKNKIKLLAILVLFGLSITRLFLWYSKSDISWIISNKSEDWREASKYIQSEIKPNDTVIFYAYFGRQPFEFYTKSSQIVEISSSNYALGGGRALPNPDIVKIKNMTSPRIWLVESHYDDTTFKRNYQKDMTEMAIQENYVKSKETQFSRIKVLLFVNKAQ